MDVRGRVDVHASARGAWAVNEVRGKGVKHAKSENVITPTPGRHGSAMIVSDFGKYVNIWSDLWLPDPHGGLVRGQSINHNYTLVSDLIDVQSATWKVEILNRLFDSDLVQQVCSIPLSKTGLCDEVIWRYDSSGFYNVKSGYRLLQEEVQSDSGTHVGAKLLISRFYAGMWGSSLPAKVKITMWRIMNNYLPTYANLQARRLNVINCCPLCKREAENIEHIMRECVFVKELLETQRIPLTTQDADVPWKEWLALAFARLTPTWRHALMITYWTVWYARNKPWTSPGSARA
ncbi:hypothetical protein V6N13_098881 [Hibiscus sabdariffa]